MEVWCVCSGEEEEEKEGERAGRQGGRACGGRELTPFVCMCGRVLLRRVEEGRCCSRLPR